MFPPSQASCQDSSSFYCALSILCPCCKERSHHSWLARSVLGAAVAPLPAPTAANISVWLLSGSKRHSRACGSINVSVGHDQSRNCLHITVAGGHSRLMPLACRKHSRRRNTAAAATVGGHRAWGTRHSSLSTQIGLPPVVYTSCSSHHSAIVFLLSLSLPRLCALITSRIRRCTTLRAGQ